jgi:hypothetical protein
MKRADAAPRRSASNRPFRSTRSDLRRHRRQPSSWGTLVAECAYRRVGNSPSAGVFEPSSLGIYSRPFAYSPSALLCTIRYSPTRTADREIDAMRHRPLADRDRDRVSDAEAPTLSLRIGDRLSSISPVACRRECCRKSLRRISSEFSSAAATPWILLRAVSAHVAAAPRRGETPLGTHGDWIRPRGPLGFHPPAGSETIPVRILGRSSARLRPIEALKSKGCSRGSPRSPLSSVSPRPPMRRRPRAARGSRAHRWD